jgi:hypothetical protein
MKDREDKANPRNYKPMVPIQFQESVHCLAWMLFLLSRLGGGLTEALSGGLTLTAESEPYEPPDPKGFPYVVDGRCDWRMTVGATQITGRTDFKRHAPWSKRRTVRGEADGKKFELEVEYLEGHKQLLVNGVDQQPDPNSNSYVQVIETFARWRQEVPRERLMSEVFPNPRFAHATYQLSSALWRSSYDRRPLSFNSHAALMAFDAAFQKAVPKFAQYQ